MFNFYIGRQPIYNRNLKIYGYELLFRSSEENQASVVDADAATSQLISNTFVELGLDRIVGAHHAFINLTRSFIVGDYPLPAAESQIVLEVLEDIEVDDVLIEALRDLSQRGYRIALDDFIYHERLRPLVEVADLIKIDVLAMDRDTVKRHVTELREYDVELLAEKVETQDELDFCRQLGFDYFQGYFLCHPNIIKGKRLPVGRASVLHLLAQLQDPNVDIDSLEEIISSDLSLSYRLLRYINSAFFALPKRVESIRSAVVYLGVRTIKMWATMSALTGIGENSYELLLTSMIRAKMCEGLAQATQQAHPETFFTVGLLSALDALLEMPMDEVLAYMPMSDEVAEALTSHSGEAGHALRCALTYEQADWDRAAFLWLRPSVITGCYLDAVSWSDKAINALRD
ncbi:MAG: HDOD domain-containing protein [Gammaproteobacteria bacterium]|nr:HDOD domain-containing protein [Gammaproteobacteria bacterium]